MTKLQKQMLQLIENRPNTELPASYWAFQAMANVNWSKEAYNRRIYAVLDLADKNLITTTEDNYFSVKVGA